MRSLRPNQEKLNRAKPANPFGFWVSQPVSHGRKYLGSFLGGLILLGMVFSLAEAQARTISLNPPDKGISRVSISKGAAVQLSNDFKAALHNLMIIEVSSGRKVISVRKFLPGQTMELEFNQEGTYVICYSIGPEVQRVNDMCLQINVGGLQPV
ncbi:MAG: hypothetical protein ACE5E9_01600 [Nitrospinaceae bacterium]